MSAVKGIEQLMTVEDIAQVLGISPRQVSRTLIDTRVIRSVRISPRVRRVEPADFRAYLASIKPR